MKTLNHAFAALRNTTFLPLTGAHYLKLERLSPISFDVRLYPCGDCSKPTWPVVITAPEDLRYYTVNPNGTDDWLEVSDERIAIRPTDCTAFARVTFLEDGTPIVSMMRPTVMLSLVELALWMPSCTRLATFVDMVDHRTSFSQKEILELIHRADCAVATKYSLGAKQRALRMHMA